MYTKYKHYSQSSHQQIVRSIMYTIYKQYSQSSHQQIVRSIMYAMYKQYSHYHINKSSEAYILLNTLSDQCNTAKIIPTLEPDETSMEAPLNVIVPLLFFSPNPKHHKLLATVYINNASYTIQLSCKNSHQHKHINTRFKKWLASYVTEGIGFTIYNVRCSKAKVNTTLFIHV